MTPQLERELQLFPDWYLKRHLARPLSAADAQVLRQAFDLILANNLAQPRVYVHRDYHSRNLMISEPLPGVLDFQDAVFGPITYDLVSLLRDAYVRWEEERVLDWAVRYWERARRAHLPVATDFTILPRLRGMGVQRQVKVVSIFARLWHRDGKERYLADIRWCSTTSCAPAGVTGTQCAGAVSSDSGRSRARRCRRQMKAMIPGAASACALLPTACRRRSPRPAASRSSSGSWSGSRARAFATS
jgi:hypothetical protein